MSFPVVVGVGSASSNQNTGRRSPSNHSGVGGGAGGAGGTSSMRSSSLSSPLQAAAAVVDLLTTTSSTSGTPLPPPAPAASQSQQQQSPQGSWGWGGSGGGSGGQPYYTQHQGGTTTTTSSSTRSTTPRSTSTHPLAPPPPPPFYSGGGGTSGGGGRAVGSHHNGHHHGNSHRRTSSGSGHGHGQAAGNSGTPTPSGGSTTPISITIGGVGGALGGALVCSASLQQQQSYNYFHSTGPAPLQPIAVGGGGGAGGSDSRGGSPPQEPSFSPPLIATMAAFSGSRSGGGVSGRPHVVASSSSSSSAVVVVPPQPISSSPQQQQQHQQQQRQRQYQQQQQLHFGSHHRQPQQPLSSPPPPPPPPPPHPSQPQSSYPPAPSSALHLQAGTRSPLSVSSSEVAVVPSSHHSHLKKSHHHHHHQSTLYSTPNPTYSPAAAAAVAAASSSVTSSSFSSSSPMMSLPAATGGAAAPHGSAPSSPSSLPAGGSQWSSSPPPPLQANQANQQQIYAAYYKKMSFSIDLSRTADPNAVLERLTRALRECREVGVDWARATDPSDPAAAAAYIEAVFDGEHQFSSSSSSTSGVQRVGGHADDTVAAAHPPNSSCSSAAGNSNSNTSSTSSSSRPPDVRAHLQRAFADRVTVPAQVSIIRSMTSDAHRGRVRDLLVHRLLPALGGSATSSTPPSAVSSIGSGGGGGGGETGLSTTTTGPGSALGGVSPNRAGTNTSTTTTATTSAGVATAAAQTAAHSARMLAELACQELLPLDGMARTLEALIKERATVRAAVAVLGHLAERMAGNDTFQRSVAPLQPLLQREAAADPSLDYDSTFIARRLGWVLPGPRLKLLQRLPQGPHRQVISSAYFSTTDELVTAGREGTVAVWGHPTYRSAPSARLALPPSYHASAMQAFPRGRILAVACVAPAPSPPLIRLYACPDDSPASSEWRLQETIERDDATAITCLQRTNPPPSVNSSSSSGGNTFVIAEADGRSHALVMFAMGPEASRPTRTIANAHSDFITVLQPSLDYNWLFSGSRDGVVKAWDTRSGSHNALHTLSTHKDCISGVAVTGDHVVTAGLDRRVCLWDIRRLRKPICDRLFASPVLRVSVLAGGEHPAILAATTTMLAQLSFAGGLLIIEDIVPNRTFTELQTNHGSTLLFASGPAGTDIFALA